MNRRHAGHASHHRFPVTAAGHAPQLRPAMKTVLRSLTQFTPASIDVAAVNVPERTVARGVNKIE